MTQPKHGQIVEYRGKLGLQAVRPALVVASVDNLDPRGVENDPRLALDSPTHAHLLVFTPSDGGFFMEFNVASGDGPGEWQPLVDQHGPAPSSEDAYRRAGECIAQAQAQNDHRSAALLDAGRTWITLAESLDRRPRRRPARGGGDTR
ncbi:hypothetical protein [Saccharothrix hoggarensis]|uniref:Uncharacterized protein n=1 Tax=Saccharothrix hoggarensis TaxID=913853 RepID=A0ABW3QN45_9PSEU